jgi:hypothetical protein
MTDNDTKKTKREPLPVPPDVQAVTAYDRAHFRAYIRLLDAEAAGADWRAASSNILAIDPDVDPTIARKSYEAHLARAKWMTRVGYRLLRQKNKD